MKNAREALLLLRRCHTVLEDLIRYDAIVEVLDLTSGCNVVTRMISKTEALAEASIVAATIGGMPIKQTKDAVKLMALEMPKVLRAARIAETEMMTNDKPTERQIEAFYEISSYISDTAKEFVDLFVNVV